MSSKSKNSGKVKKVTDYTEKKYISFDELKRISDENFERFNRNVDYEQIEREHFDIRPPFFKITKLMEHSTFVGSPSEKHFRCLVLHPKISEVMIQDISLEQWDRINN